MAAIRWRLAEEEGGQLRLFDGLAEGDEVIERRPGEGQFAGLEFLHVRARRIINEIPAQAGLPFRFTVNVYRGCSHACTYCFARPSHTYLGLDAGGDFERRIVVKVNAVERLQAELASPRWRADAIAMGTNTDPYQRAEGRYRLTRGIIGVLAGASNPFSILTKSPLILRDLDVLTEAAARTRVHTAFSVGTLDEEVWRMTEPGAPHPRRRLEAVARLNAAGVPCGVLVAPVIPGLSDTPHQIEAVVRAAAEAGAVSISALWLHLRPGVREHFLAALARHRPDLAARHERLYVRPYLPPARQRALGSFVEAVARRASAAATSA